VQRAEADSAAFVPAVGLLKAAASYAALAILEQQHQSFRGAEPELTGVGWQTVCTEVGLKGSNELWREWLSQPVEKFWDVPPTRSRMNELLDVTSQLIRFAKRASLKLDAIWFRRTYRIGVPVILASVGVGLFAYTSYREVVARETAFPWTASSATGDGCVSPSQECAEARYFFHTREENQPWIEFDLRRESQVQSVKIGNRNDCEYCPDRAIPLVAEISSDHQHWTEIARNDKAFDEWYLKIGKKARWIRFRSLKKTFLHFRQVRIRVE